MGDQAQAEHMANLREKSRLAAQERREAGLPRVRSHWEKWEAKNTRGTAINAMCEHCMGGPNTPGLREDIQNCTAGPKSRTPCPLYDWRPYQ